MTQAQMTVYLPRDLLEQETSEVEPSRSAQRLDNQSACEERLLRLASASSAIGSSRHSLRARLMLNIGSCRDSRDPEAPCNGRKEDSDEKGYQTRPNRCTK